MSEGGSLALDDQVREVISPHEMEDPAHFPGGRPEDHSASTAQLLAEPDQCVDPRAVHELEVSEVEVEISGFAQKRLQLLDQVVCSGYIKLTHHPKSTGV